MKTRFLLPAGAILLLLMSVMSGCAVQPKVRSERFFWPRLPERPRIEWVDAYASQLDFPQTGFHKFMEKIIGGDSPVSFASPLDIRSDGLGKVYVSDPGVPAVFVYDFNSLEISVLGQESSVPILAKPLGLAVDGDANVYVSDRAIGGVVVFDRKGTPLRTFITKGQIGRITAMAVDRVRKRLLVTDTKGHKIGVFTLKGQFLFSFGAPGGGDGEFNFPVAVTVNSKGDILVADAMNARVQIFDPEGRFLRKFGQRGDGPGNFQLIKGVATDSDDNIYVTEGKGNMLMIFSPAGELLLNIGGFYDVSTSGKLAPGGFVFPQGIDIDQNDMIYVVDQMNARFQVFQYISDRFLKTHPIEGIREGK